MSKEFKAMLKDMYENGKYLSPSELFKKLEKREKEKEHQSKKELDQEPNGDPFRQKHT